MFSITCFIFCKWSEWNHITWVSSSGKFISETGEKAAERILLSAHLPSQGLFPKCQKEKKGITLNVQNNKGKSKSCLLNFKGLISNNLKETISPPPQGGFGCTLFLSTFCTKFRFSPQHQMQSLVVLNSSEAF